MKKETIINKLEDILKSIKPYEKNGLDTSSLKIFIKSFNTFASLNPELFNEDSISEISIKEKLFIIKTFLEDRVAFPRISDVIDFANKNLDTEFKDQKESRALTIKLILGRIERTPELKDKLKSAVIKIRNEKAHPTSNKKRTKKEMMTAETFLKWAEILKNI